MVSRTLGAAAPSSDVRETLQDPEFRRLWKAAHITEVVMERNNLLRDPSASFLGWQKGCHQDSHCEGTCPVPDLKERAADPQGGHRLWTTAVDIV